MKNFSKIVLLLVFTKLSVFNITAQSSINEAENEAEIDESINEIRLNALYLLLGAFEANYEYVLNENSGIGLTVMYTYDDDLWEFKHQISGYYRQYFAKKYAGGFYGEVFAMYNSIEDYDYYYTGSYTEFKENNSHNLGIGFAFGTKLISRNNLLLDVGIGLARNIYTSREDDWLVPRFNVSFGYRF
ncbi:DUF3575 domain-containing protein [Psychroflexus planctonicus]|uniref:DUF3575 domain-containing protein n=1 Tax=Psychroflexus planctonicus TaxID=1526575 RepID=A0ABQ1SLW8_9FLAO|nr:DUF3575 domain-containing protein [Psychroflexus planctonicus]GGE43421.1 hypothetical protein GCM10010832_24210 [Psychroflexus planctonicus]